MILNNEQVNAIGKLHAVTMEDHRNVAFSNFVYVVNKGASVMDTSSDMHIPGVKPGDIVLQSKGINLGSEIHATVLATREVYAEYTAEEGYPIARWSIEDAESMETLEARNVRLGLRDLESKSSKFIHVTPEGNQLKKNALVVVFLHDPQLAPANKIAVVVFKSTGLRFFNSLQKDFMTASQKDSVHMVWPSVRFILKSESIDTSKGTYLYPKFKKYPKLNFCFAEKDDGVHLIAGTGYTGSEENALVLLEESEKMTELVKSPSFTKQVSVVDSPKILIGKEEYNGKEIPFVGDREQTIVSDSESNSEIESEEDLPF